MRVVGDHHDGLAKVAIELLQKLQHVTGTDGVKIAGGLVGEDQIRIGHDRAGNGDALFLPAGQLSGKMVHAVVEPDQLQDRCAHLAVLGSRQARELERQLHVLTRGENGDQVERLKEESDVVVPPAGERAFGHHRRFFIQDDEPSAAGFVHAGNEVKQRALSRAGRAHEGDKLAALHGEINLVQREDGRLATLELLGQADRFQKRIVHNFAFIPLLPRHWPSHHPAGIGAG
jgi:hypothetical protein